MDSSLIHPERLAAGLGIKYLRLPHNHERLPIYIAKMGFTLGVIAGARILSEDVIEAFKIGVMNVHPGLLPENRGLDAMLWAIEYWLPQAVTAHLIDGYVDWGRRLAQRVVPVYPEDELRDLSARIYDYSLAILEDGITAAVQGDWQQMTNRNNHRPHSRMTDEHARKTMREWRRYKKCNDYTSITSPG
jgi:phosphoribosylglycinamide formyltransferase-1